MNHVLAGVDIPIGKENFGVVRPAHWKSCVALRSKDKSPLPLTDPRDAVPQAHRVVHRCRRSVW